MMMSNEEIINEYKIKKLLGDKINFKSDRDVILFFMEKARQDVLKCIKCRKTKNLRLCCNCTAKLINKARQEGYREGFNEALRPIREFLKLIGVEK